MGIPLDRLDHQIKLVGAVDFPGHAAKTVVVDDLGFAEVVEPIEALGIVVLLRGKQHGKRPSFRWVSDS